MATFCLPKNYIFDNSNFARAHIAQLVEHFHGKEEVASSILAVGTANYIFLTIVLNFKFSGFNFLLDLSKHVLAKKFFTSF